MVKTATSMPCWRRKQRENFRDVGELIRFLKLSPGQASKLIFRPRFGLNLPRRLAEKIEKNSLVDPIGLQFLPLALEDNRSSASCSEPVCDQAFQLTSRLLHKYQGRVLLLTTGACPMHCRFCFRQNYPYDTHTEPPSASYAQEIDRIKQDESIFEVILSGGDPLSLSDVRLESLIESLESIPHLKLLRIHTRFLAGIPERLTSSLLTLLCSTRLQPVCVLHFNHPKELDLEVQSAVRRLARSGVTVLSHTVLLRGVNDRLPILETLLRLFLELGVVPYYLHQLDRVSGADHFHLPKSTGRELVEQLRARLPGYGVPRYVEEIPFKSSKIPIG